jgi:pimeloyl-ACP methyl ester carboxylesterase
MRIRSGSVGRGRHDEARHATHAAFSGRFAGAGARLAVAALLAVLIAGCSAPPTERERRVVIDGFETTFEEVREPAVVEVDCGALQAGAAITATEFVGRTAERATYLHYTPDEDWNGELVLYARGYVPPGFLNLLVIAFLRGDVSDPRLQEIVDLRNALLCDGYAFALSAYADDGYAVEEGFRDTHLLNALFAWHGEEPTRTYVMGHSMGALIATALLESFPHAYQAGLATCGPLGGSLLQMDYIGNVRVVFDQLFPGVIEGDVLTPTEQTFDEVVAAVVQALADADPALIELLASVTVAGQVPATVHDAGLPAGVVRLLRHDPVDPDAAALGDALARPLFYEVAGKEDVLARGDGGLSFDNLDAIYLPEDVDPEEAPVPRYAGDLGAVEYFGDWYTSSGTLTRPLRVVHSEFDADVPAFHVDAYLAGLDVFGRDLVDAVIIPGDTSHCVMSTDALYGHFQELVQTATP